MKSLGVKILLYLLITLFLFKIGMLIFKVYFYSMHIELYFWFLLLFLGLLIWFFSLETKGKIILGAIAPVAYIVFYGIVTYFTWFFVGTIDEVKPEKFKNIDQKVWMQFHQGSWGGRAYFTVGIGESYFWGLMYSKENEFEFEFDMENSLVVNGNEYEIPHGVTP